MKTLLTLIQNGQPIAYQINQEPNVEFPGSLPKLEKNGMIRKMHPYLIKETQQMSMRRNIRNPREN